METNSIYWQKLLEKIEDIKNALEGNGASPGDNYKNIYSNFWKVLFEQLDTVIAAITSSVSTGDYNHLINKPAIDGNGLDQDSTAEDLGLAKMTDLDNKLDKQTGPDPDGLHSTYIKTKDGNQGMLHFTVPNRPGSIVEREDDTGQIHIGNAIDNDAAVTLQQQDEAIAVAKLATQSWRPAVETKADLADPSTLDPTVNYLCRVIKDSTSTNNGVWQLIAGDEEWTYFSDNLDFIDEIEMEAAIGVEKTRATGAEGTLNTAIGAETTRATDAEKVLLDRVYPIATSSGSTHRIVTGDDLDDPKFLAPGVYISTLAATTASLLNKPLMLNSAFVMYVEANGAAPNPPVDSSVGTQHIYAFGSTTYEIVRAWSVSGHGPWRLISASNTKGVGFTLNSTTDIQEIVDFVTTAGLHYISLNLAGDVTITADQWRNLIANRTTYVNLTGGRMLTIDGANAGFSACKVIFNADTVSNRGIVTFVNTTTLSLANAHISGYAIQFNIPPITQFVSQFSTFYMGGAVFNATGARTNSLLLLQHGSFTELNNVVFSSENPMPVPFITNNESFVVVPGAVTYPGSPDLRKLVSHTGNIIGPNTGRLAKELIYIPTAYLFRALTATEWADFKTIGLTAAPQCIAVDMSSVTNKPSSTIQRATCEFWYVSPNYIMVRLTVITSSVANEYNDVYQGMWSQDSASTGVWMGWKKLTP
jgi:hypothetical protein